MATRRYNNLSIVLPYRSDHGGRRDQLAAFVVERLRRILPGAEVCYGVDDGEHFSRALAINRGAALATRPILLITDTDLVYPVRIIDEAIAALAHHAWVIPYTEYLALSKPQTDAILAAGKVVGLNLSGAHHKYITTGSTGGMTVITRETYWRVGGHDERFVGWGCEDTAFCIAADTLAGPHLRQPYRIWHLWHERARKGAIESGTWERSRERLLRYRKAAGDADHIRELVAL